VVFVDIESTAFLITEKSFNRKQHRVTVAGLRFKEIHSGPKSCSIKQKVGELKNSSI
jgi:hypothetical protein